MLGDCGYARLSESGFNERFTLCSGRALKKKLWSQALWDLSGWLSRLWVSFIWVGRVNGQNLFYNVHISIHNKQLEVKKKSRIM